jgi:predicted TIM-barrel fold metal-dependent hydrolase
MKRRIELCLITCCLINVLFAQTKKNLPVIDMHLHAMRANAQGPAPMTMKTPFRDLGYHDPKNAFAQTFMQLMKSNAWSDNNILSPTTDDSLQTLTIAALKRRNVYAVTSGEISLVRKWKAAAPDRIINAVQWNFNQISKQGLTVDSLERLFKSGEFKVFGEVYIQYEGYSPSDSAFEPYLAMAEKLDIPVGIHVGTGPPGSPYLGFTKYRAHLHSALVLEDALVRHPKLRVYAMHAGWPMLDDMLAALYVHPQLYIDLGIICYMLPTKEFYFYLERLVGAGFGKRIMFGSDNMVWPQTIEIGIKKIEQATFMTDEQKRDILFNNAARFLRLTEIQIRSMQ